jgi:hypothetical protein
VFATVCILYCIPILEAPRPGRQTKHDFFKKILMFIGWGRRGWSGLPRGSYVRWGTDEHKANVAPGWLRDYMAYVCRPGGTNEHKGLRFISSAWPTNVS